MATSCVDYCVRGGLASFVKQLQQWLQAHSEQLDAAGYTACQAALQQLQQLQSSLEGVVAESVFGMCQHLQLAGLALCSLPVQQPCMHQHSWIDGAAPGVGA